MNGSYYNNLYRDAKGQLCWSETGAMFTSVQQAWAEAAIYQGFFDWEYIATVGTNAGGTNKKDVDAIANAIKEGKRQFFSVPSYNATFDELCEYADAAESEFYE